MIIKIIKTEIVRELIRVTNISKSFTHKTSAKTSWHRYGTTLRHCHLMYNRLMLGLFLRTDHKH